MTRLQAEMQQVTPDYFFDIKRGEKPPKDKSIISNEASGLALLAIDLLEPWSCHQIYKIFNEKYGEIFGRQEVNAKRVIHVMEIMRVIDGRLEGIELKPLAHYALTKYFLASVLSRILRSYDASLAIMRNPGILTPQTEASFLEKCDVIVASLIIDLNYEVKEKGPSFDYKADLKSPKQIDEMSNALLKSYEKDVARGKAEGF